MVNADKVAYDNFTVTIGNKRLYWHNTDNGTKPYIAFITVTGLCQGCQSHQVWRESNSYESWQGISIWMSNIRCKLCERLGGKDLEYAEAMMRDDDAHRERLTTAIETGSGTKPTFTVSGTMVHEQIERLTNRGWYPTWIAQDGSVEALEQLHALSDVFGVQLRAVEGFLLFPGIEVLSTARRSQYQQTIDTLTAHKQLVDELTAKT